MINTAFNSHLQMNNIVLSIKDIIPMLLYLMVAKSNMTDW